MPRTKPSPTKVEEDEARTSQVEMASTNILDKCYGDMEKFLINYKKRDEEKQKLAALRKTESHAIARQESTHSLQMQNPKSAPGRQLSKAERYRWIIQEPSAAPSQQPQNLRGTSPKSSEPSPTSPTRNAGSAHNSARLGPAGDVSYNSRLFKSILKGASDFKCKHCGESFDKLDSLTKHMMIQGHFTETDDDAQAADSLNLSRKSSASLDLRTGAKGDARNGVKNGREDESSAAKVLSCLRCGASFDSLPDLSCHMARTNHHESIPSLKTYNSSSQSSPFGQLQKPGQKGNFHFANSYPSFSGAAASLPSVPLFPPSSLGASFLQPSAAALGRLPMLPGAASLPLYNFFPLMRPQVSPALQSLLQQQTLALLQSQLNQNLAAQNVQNSDNDDNEETRSQASSSKSPHLNFQAASRSRVSSVSNNCTVRDSGKERGRHGEEPLDLSKKRPLSCSRPNSPILEKESAMSHDSDIDIVAPTSPGTNENIHNEDEEIEPPQKIPHLEHPIPSPDEFSSRKSSASPPHSRGNPIMAIENLINSQNLEKKKTKWNG